MGQKQESSAQISAALKILLQAGMVAQGSAPDPPELAVPVGAAPVVPAASSDEQPDAMLINRAEAVAFTVA